MVQERDFTETPPLMFWIVELFTIMDFLLRVDENSRSNPELLVVQDMSRFNVVLYLFTHAFYNCLIG